MKLIKEFELGKLAGDKLVGGYITEGGFEIHKALFLECKCGTFVLIGFVESTDVRPSENKLFECPFCKHDNYKFFSFGGADVLLTIEGLASEGCDEGFQNRRSVISKATSLAIDIMQKSRDEAL